MSKKIRPLDIFVILLYNINTITKVSKQMKRIKTYLKTGDVAPFSIRALREFSHPYVEKKTTSKFHLNCIIAVVCSAVAVALSLLSPIAGLVIASLFFAVTIAFTAMHIYAHFKKSERPTADDYKNRAHDKESDEKVSRKFFLHHYTEDPHAKLYKKKQPIFNMTTLTHFFSGAAIFTLALCLFLFLQNPIFAMIASTAVCGILLPFYIKSIVAMAHSSVPVYEETLRLIKRQVGIKREKMPDLITLYRTESIALNPDGSERLVERFSPRRHKQPPKEVPYHTELVEERIEDIQAYDDRLVYFSSLGGVFNLNF